LPGKAIEKIQAALTKPRGSRSMSKHLHSQLGIDGVKAALLRELAPAEAFADPLLLSKALKALPLTLIKTRPIDEAISTAGGVPFEALTEELMLKQLPGVFCAGEMLDWEAPTGGYLLTACFASGRAAGLGMVAWLRSLLELPKAAIDREKSQPSAAPTESSASPKSLWDRTCSGSGRRGVPEGPRCCFREQVRSQVSSASGS
jgi:succinate dehydrogenase/fumarate reductase flavoprotein subunit